MNYYRPPELELLRDDATMAHGYYVHQGRKLAEFVEVRNTRWAPEALEFLVRRGRELVAEGYELRQGANARGEWTRFEFRAPGAI